MLSLLFQILTAEEKRYTYHFVVSLRDKFLPHIKIKIVINYNSVYIKKLKLNEN